MSSTPLLCRKFVKSPEIQCKRFKIRICYQVVTKFSHLQQDRQWALMSKLQMKREINKISRKLTFSKVEPSTFLLRRSKKSHQKKCFQLLPPRLHWRESRESTTSNPQRDSKTSGKTPNGGNSKLKQSKQNVNKKNNKN